LNILTISAILKTRNQVPKKCLMPKLKLTDVTVDRLPHTKNQVTYWDALLPAFGVRVGANSKTFIVIRNNGRRTKLGRYPFLSLADARSQDRLLIAHGHSGS